MRQNGFLDAIQFLVPVIEDSGRVNIQRIKEHNKNPDGFMNEYISNQTRLIYGPLITHFGIDENGIGSPLSDEEIITNLSKSRNYNVSYGSLIASCQSNALADMMRKLGISEDVIKEGIEGMRRIDAPNIVKPSVDPNFPSPSSVIIEGSNDELVKLFMYGRFPEIPENHTNMDIVTIDDHRIKVYQKLPEEVYHPGKASTPDQREREQFLKDVSSQMLATKIEQKQEQEKPKPFIKAFYKVIFKLREENMLKFENLEALRFKDAEMHNLMLFTGEETKGHEIEGRDKDLLYKFMTDMMTREKSNEVSAFLDQNTTHNSISL